MHRGVLGILLFFGLLFSACGNGQGEEGNFKAKNAESQVARKEVLPELERAVGLLNHGRPADAIRVIDSLSLNGDKGKIERFRRDILIVKAQALDGVDSTAAAKECALRALAWPPRDANDHLALFRDYAYAASVFFYYKEREEDAIAWCRKALEHAKACEHDPGSTFVNLLLGNLYLHQSKPMEALALYEEALREAATPAAEAEYSIQLCNIYKRYGLFEEANRAADIALKNVMSGAVEHAKMKCSALAVKGFCMIALAPDSAMMYLTQAEEAAEVLPYNSGLVEIDLYVALHLAPLNPPLRGEAVSRLNRIIEKSNVEPKREEARALLDKISRSEEIQLIAEGDRTAGSIARALLSQSETLHEIMQENREMAHKNEVMRVWIVACVAIILLIVVAIALAVVHLRHRAKKAKLIREHEAHKEQLRQEQERLKEQHRMEQERLQEQLEKAMLAESLTKQKFEQMNRKRVLDRLTPELLKKVGFDAFRRQFDAYYPEAIDRLSAAAGSLGPREQLICMLLILNVDNPRMAELMAISRDSVNKARYRLRQKFNLANEQELEEEIFKITGIKRGS